MAGLPCSRPQGLSQAEAAWWDDCRLSQASPLITAGTRPEGTLMNEIACEQASRPQALQKASRRSGPHLDRTSPIDLKAVLGQQWEQQGEPQVFQAML